MLAVINSSQLPAQHMMAHICVFRGLGGAVNLRPSSCFCLTGSIIYDKNASAAKSASGFLSVAASASIIST